jgi:tryptophan-rich sensory protein
MKPHIDATKFGSITVDGDTFDHDIVIRLNVMIAVWRHSRWVALAQLPYFVWVSIATVPQLSITWMNWGE